MKIKSVCNPQSGSAFLYIIIAIALLAALSVAVSRGNRGSTSTMSDQQAKLAAQEIIDYGNTVAAAVQKLRLRGCTDTQISFENNIVTGYANPNAPSDKSCHVFDPAGANIVFKGQIASEWLATAPMNWTFNRQFHINDVGTTCSNPSCADLALNAQFLKKDICMEINDILGIENPLSDAPIDTDHDYQPFIGSYLTGNIVGDEAGSAGLSGKSAGCFYTTSTGAYHFYQVLIAR